MLKGFVNYLVSHTLEEWLEELVKLTSDSPIRSLWIHQNNLANLSATDFERLVAGISSIDAPINSLSLLRNHLGNLPEPGLIRLLENIHMPIKNLDLTNNNLFRLGPGLINIFKKLPATLDALVLNHNSLNELGRYLPNILSEIPPHITDLRLANNDLGELDEELLIRALQAIPATVKILDLSRNKLGSVPGRLARVLAAIPQTVTSLNLDDNNLDLVPSEQWVDIFAALPRGLTKLNLNSGNLNQLLENSLAELPPTLITLNLYGNNLNQSRVPLAEILRGIRVPVRDLDLSLNDLSQKLNLENNGLVPFSQVDLINLFSAIPQTVNNLLLMGTNLGSFPVETLVAALQHLPPSVKLLQLAQCDFHTKTDEELMAILNAIPETVETIDLSYNGLENRTSPHLISALLRTGKTFIVEDPLARELVTEQRIPILNEIRDAHQNLLSENRSTLFHTFNDSHAEHRVFKEIFEYASPIKSTGS